LRGAEGAGGSVERLLAEAAAFRLLGLLFERPRAGWKAEVVAVAREVGDPAVREAAEALAEFTEADHLALLGPGGRVSPREVSYRGLEDPGRVVSDLALRYEAFAYRPETEEPLDHVSVETGFVGYLMLKQAYAASRLDHEAMGVAREACGRFLGEHLGPLARGVEQRLEGIGEAGPLCLAARALVEKVGQAARLLEAVSR